MPSRYRLLCLVLLLGGCTDSTTSWSLQLHHDTQGEVLDGSHNQMINAIRNGCEIRVAWGGGSPDHPRGSVEHVSPAEWITLRDDNQISVQISGYISNQDVLDQGDTDTSQVGQYGGTRHLVAWRSTLKTDGTFNAVWYYPHNGEFITRRPQRYAMKWFSDCSPVEAPSLYEHWIDPNMES